MSNGRKYANLPDLDLAPDVYETPDLIDDISTQETSTILRSESPASSYYDPDDDHVRIDRHRLDPDEARTHFSPPQRTRNDLGLPERIHDKRRQYRDSSRRRRNESEGPEHLGLNDDEDEESLERKVARLRQEVAEVKGEFERRRAREEHGEAKDGAEEDTLDALSRVLHGSTATNTNGAANRMVKQLRNASRAYDSSKLASTAEAREQNQQGPEYSVAYAPSYQQNHALAKVADFDARIGFIETLLGINTIPLPTQERLSTRAIFPILDNLDRQISTLSSSTESSLDSITRRVRKLTQDAQKLTEARTAAKAAQEALDSELSDTARPLNSNNEGVKNGLEDPEQISKINALYGTLATIESLAPLLPSVLDRLRSLQTVHAEAATASQTLTQLEARQDAMVQDLKGWKEGLEKIESAMNHGEHTMAGNLTVVEKWVKELEDRIKKLGQ